MHVSDSPGRVHQLVPEETDLRCSANVSKKDDEYIPCGRRAKRIDAITYECERHGEMH